MDKLFTGICTALATPFSKNQVDYKAFTKLIELQLKNKIDALLFLGTTGEAPTLSSQEKQEIIRFALKTVDNRVPVIFGLGGNSPVDIISLGKFVAHTAKINKSENISVMVSAPYYNKCTQSGAVEFFTKIANEIKLPMIVYNVPGRTGVNLEPATLSKISENKFVAGIKEACGNIAQISEVIQLCKNTAVYSGDDALALPCYSVGCSGIISVASNVIPKDVRDVYNAYRCQQNALARDMFLSQLPLYKALFCEVNPIPVKFALSHLGITKNEVRLPLTPLTSQNQDIIRRLLFLENEATSVEILAE